MREFLYRILYRNLYEFMEFRGYFKLYLWKCKEFYIKFYMYMYFGNVILGN